MSITRTYMCNLCRATSEPQRLVGLYWQAFPAGWIEKPARDVETHICQRCVSNIQSMKALCGQGYECDGGPLCGSDHK